MNTHGVICDFGKHANTPYTRIPVGYLLWMVNSGHSKADIAKAELDRRGTVVPDMDISPHAINRASQKLLSIWIGTRQKDEGIHSWLVRMARMALNEGVLVSPHKYKLQNIYFVFEEGGEWPVLKTVMLRNGEDTT